MNAPNKLIWTSSYDIPKMWYNYMDGKKKSSEVKEIVRLVRGRFRDIPQSLGIPHKDGEEEPILWSEVQDGMEQNTDGVLERQEHSVLPKTQQRYKWFKEPELAGWSEEGQRRLYTPLSTASSTLRRGWIRKRASLSNGGGVTKVFTTRGGSAS